VVVSIPLNHCVVAGLPMMFIFGVLVEQLMMDLKRGNGITGAVGSVCGNLRTGCLTKNTTP
jgi:hypothetical protein